MLFKQPIQCSMIKRVPGPSVLFGSQIYRQIDPPSPSRFDNPLGGLGGWTRIEKFRLPKWDSDPRPSDCHVDPFSHWTMLAPWVKSFALSFMVSVFGLFHQYKYICVEMVNFNVEPWWPHIDTLCTLMIYLNPQSVWGCSHNWRMYKWVKLPFRLHGLVD